MMKLPRKAVILGVTGLIGLGLIATPVLARSASNPPPPAQQKIEAAVSGLVQQGAITESQARAVIEAISSAWDQAASAKEKSAPQARNQAQGKGLLERFRHAAPKGLAFGMFQGRHQIYAAVAESIGIEPKDLLKELKDGKSLKTVIEEHGKTVDQVVSDLMTRLAARLDKAVENGHITEAQKARILEDMGGILPRVIDLQDVRNEIKKAHPAPKPAQTGPKHERSKEQRPAPMPVLKVPQPIAPAEIAQALGLQPGDVLSELRGGKTLKQVIEEHGSTVDQVVDALAAKQKTRLDEAVKNQRITQAQADEILANFKDGVRKAIETHKPVAGLPRKAQPTPQPSATATA